MGELPSHIGEIDAEPAGQIHQRRCRSTITGLPLHQSMRQPGLVLCGELGGTLFHRHLRREDQILASRPVGQFDRGALPAGDLLQGERQIHIIGVLGVQGQIADILMAMLGDERPG